MNTYEWNIKQLACKPQEEGKSNVVVTADWTVSVTDGTYTSSLYGTQEFSLNTESNFTPFENLTKDQVVGWVQSAMGIDDVTALQQKLDTQLEEQINPPIIKPKLPWSTEPF